MFVWISVCMFHIDGEGKEHVNVIDQSPLIADGAVSSKSSISLYFASNPLTCTNLKNCRVEHFCDLREKLDTCWWEVSLQGGTIVHANHKRQCVGLIFLRQDFWRDVTERGGMINWFPDRSRCTFKTPRMLLVPLVVAPTEGVSFPGSSLAGTYRWLRREQT